MKIVIAGGGPAGLIAALYLTRLSKAAIFIHEKLPEPDYTASLCAEGLSRGKLSKLETDTGFSSRPFFARRIQGLKITFPNRKSGYIYQDGVTLNRSAWQQGMTASLRERGVVFHFGRALTDISDIDCDWLIGADGPVSKIRKQIGGTVTQKPAVQYRMALDRPRRFLEFIFDDMLYEGKSGYGYGWVFPKEKLFNVGIAGGTFHLLDRFCEKYGIQGNILEKAGAPISINGSCFEKGHVFLLGDAAGLTNPLSCGGLSAIICCADYLARAVESIRPGTYTRLIKANYFDPAYWRCRQAVFYQPGPVLNLSGLLCDNARISPRSPAFMARFIKRPQLWRPVINIAKDIRKLKRVSW